MTRNDFVIQAALRCLKLAENVSQQRLNARSARECAERLADELGVTEAVSEIPSFARARIAELEAANEGLDAQVKALEAQLEQATAPKGRRP